MIKKISKQMSLLLLGTFISLPVSLLAEGSHNGGLFVRSLLVAGQTDLSSESEGDVRSSSEYSGLPAFEAVFSVGRIVIPNLAIHGGLDFAIAGSLKDKDDSESKRSAANFTHINVGATYYIMPANVYLGLDLRSLLFGLDAKYSVGRIGSSSAYKEKADGIGYRFVVGKEWFMSDNYGLGLALSYSHSSSTIENKNVMVGSRGGTTVTSTSTSTSTEKIKQNILGIAFSTTFN